MKKKIFLLSTFIVLALGILFGVSKPEVEAETVQNCETHTIYYLFLDATKAVTFKAAYTDFYAGASPGVFGYSIKSNGARNNDDENNGYWFYAARKRFYAVPKSNAENIEEGTIKLGKTKTSGVEMTYSEFLEKYKSLKDNVESDPVKNVTYIRAVPWVRGNTSEKEEEEIKVSNYDMSSITETTFVNHIPDDYGSPEITRYNDSNSYATFVINRNWWWKYRVKGYDNTTDDSVVIFSPAVYKITYEVCNEEEVNDPKKATVHVRFCETGDSQCNNSTSLADRIVLGSFEIGSSKPPYNCPNPLSDYSADSSHEIRVSNPEDYKLDGTDGNDGGVINDKDNDIYCYYTKNETEVVTPTEHTLTVKYGKDVADCSDLITFFTWKLGAGEKKEVDAPDTIDLAKTGTKFTYSGVGNVSPKNFNNYTVGNKKLTVTMPDDDVTICLVYTPKTGLSKGWLYLVWAIGLGSLGYSGWYFYRYYKNKKQEI